MSRGAVDTPTHPPIHVNPNIYWGPRSKQPRLEPWNAATCVRWQLLHKRAKGARDAEIPRPAFRHRCRQRILFRNSASLGPIVHPSNALLHALGGGYSTSTFSRRRAGDPYEHWSIVFLSGLTKSFSRHSDQLDFESRLSSNTVKPKVITPRYPRRNRARFI